jgi:predicted alpha/beta hydrolase family esterase/GNAT superfamily N-acetyltransferase
MTTIREASSSADIEEIRTLFDEYAQSLGVDLSFQDFGGEMAGLPGAYATPHGRLLIAAHGERPVGCVGVRPLEHGVCEMKRLYVRPEARGQGLGRQLTEAAIAFGTAAGYGTIRLDTLPTMGAAHELYRQLGFRDVAPYRYNPVPNTTFMELDLTTRPGARAPVLILPGLYNSGPAHWQSRWESVHPEMRRVIQDDWERPRCADWIARLDAAIQATPDAVLVAHSSSCALVAHWAGAHGSRRIHGALLVAPSDPEAPSYPDGPTGFAPMPLGRLPFSSVVVASTNDRYVTAERARTFADAWGSRLVTIGDAGHINSESGLGEWPAGFALLQALRRR